ncbi:kinase-like protein [Calocera cornea HHB12733]|uniref:Kinase-like protein n=1 Tax=Calocera cornea HHB12733 TaxID=1353952 RepID=A0A165IRB4_9BASI|nr:kinase-like protein [Calocera cornea HHB12733]
MWLLQHHPEVPSPKLYDYVVQTGELWDTPYFVMSEIPGQTLMEVASSMTSAELEQVGLDLRCCLAALRTIPNPHPFAVCNASGGPMTAPYFTRHYPEEPFKTVDDFYAWIRKNMTGDRDWPIVETWLAAAIAKSEDPPVFSHGDVADHNIMVDKGRLSGLVDWAEAGWFPAYWEYATAMNRIDEQTEQFKTVINIALPDHYEDERQGLIHAYRFQNFDLPDPWRWAKNADQDRKSGSAPGVTESNKVTAAETQDSGP